MQKHYRLFIRLFVVVVFLAGLYLILLILVGTFTDYRPESTIPLEISGKNSTEKINDSTFTFLTWNIGFSGLGAEMDFFYDGGKMVRPTRDEVEKYTSGMLAFLKSSDSIDFILLQEVDKNSSRTGKQDETVLINNILAEYSSSFGINYKVQFVPIPFFNPLGKLEMGQLNLSKFQSESSLRHSYFSQYSWPKRLFMLDRCFIESRFKLQNGKELVVFNTHNSAYDKGGKLRSVEMPVIRDLMLNEFKKGNYVVAGGDWNQNPAGFEAEKMNSVYKVVNREKMNEDLFPEEWQTAYDSENPTNREIDAPLTPGKTKVTAIDYYILSPNIQVEMVKVLSQNFQNSDHEPVYMLIKIK